MFHNIIDAITGDHSNGTRKMEKKIKGTVVLMKKNVLDFNDFNASVLDRVHELLGQGVSLQLVSAVNSDPSGESLIYIFLYFVAFSTSKTSSGAIFLCFILCSLLVSMHGRTSPWMK